MKNFGSTTPPIGRYSQSPDRPKRLTLSLSKLVSSFHKHWRPLQLSLDLIHLMKLKQCSYMLPDLHQFLLPKLLYLTPTR